MGLIYILFCISYSQTVEIALNGMDDQLGIYTADGILHKYEW